MMYRSAILLFVLWLAGLVYGYELGGFIHVLPMLALFIAWMEYVRVHPAA